MDLIGLSNYIVFSLTFASIYAVLCLGLNIHWGYTGMLNIAIAAFFAVGAYTGAILTTPETDSHMGGFGLPFPIAWLAAMIVSALLAIAIGTITVGLRADYLAIASIGLSEIVRLILKNEGDWTNGVRGIPSIPKPFAEIVPGVWIDYTTLILYVLVVVGVIFLIQRAYISPWGRVIRAIRESEPAVAAAGKNIRSFRLQAFVFGAAIMGLAGAMYGQFVGFISPEAFEPLFATFLVWVMLIAGGSGNNYGAVLGAVVIWGIWAGSEFVTSALPNDWATRAAYIRLFIIGFALQVILLRRPEGILPEKALKPVV